MRKMEEKDLKKKMENLWKENFKDTSEYVSLVFDNYFSPANVAYHVEHDEIVAALLGVPYTFRSSSGQTLTGLYLCGLSTKHDWRRKGLMGTLLEEINARAEKEGYDFTFLIPSSAGVRRYYADRGYHDSFYKKKEYFVRNHRFGGDAEVGVELYDPARAEEVLAFLQTGRENLAEDEHAYSMVHSGRDWEIILKEAEVSKEPVILAMRGGEVCGVAFARQPEKEKNAIEIKKLISSGPDTEKCLLGGIEKIYPDFNLTVIRDFGDRYDDAAPQIWSPFYASSNPPKAEYEDVAVVEEPYNPGRDAKAFGMIRIFDIHRLMEKIAYDTEGTLDGLTDNDLIRFLLRKPSVATKESLESLLALPRLSFTMSLLLE